MSSSMQVGRDGGPASAPVSLVALSVTPVSRVVAASEVPLSAASVVAPPSA